MLTRTSLVTLCTTALAEPDTKSAAPDTSATPRCVQAGDRELPAVVAAAVLMTADYAGPGRAECGAPVVSGCLPQHLCHFDGMVWHDTWTSDGTGVWMMPCGGTRATVRFASPPGFQDLYGATALLVADLRPRIREMVLLAHPSLEFGDVVEDHVVGPLLAEFGGRFSTLVAEVWHELREGARTAHDRMVLATERGKLAAADR